MRTLTAAVSAATVCLTMLLSDVDRCCHQGTLNSFSKTFQFLQQRMLPHPRTPRAAAGAAVAGMVKIPAAAAFEYDVTAMVDQVTLSRSRPIAFGSIRCVNASWCLMTLMTLLVTKKT